MGAAVDHVEHRHRQRYGVISAEVREQRDPALGRRSLRGCQRNAEDRVRPKSALVRRPVELDQRPVDADLVEGIAPPDGVGELAVDVRDGLHDALAPVGMLAVAELDRLVDAG